MPDYQIVFCMIAPGRQTGGTGQLAKSKSAIAPRGPVSAGGARIPRKAHRLAQTVPNTAQRAHKAGVHPGH